MKKKVKIIILAMCILSMSVPAMADTVPTVGAERWYKSELPYGYVNAYMTTRTKETNLAVGYTYLISMPSNCSGINAWICNSQKTRCSQIKHVDALNVNKAINYTSNSSMGSSVRLGLEDYDNTQIVHHTVEGYVNYN